MIDTYAVMGNPVDHSLSPLIHALFAEQTQQTLRYLKIKVPLDEFAHYLKQFQKDQGKGLNITLPFKLQAFNLVSECTERAKIAKAVNTITFFPNGRRFADNTDGEGFIRDLARFNFQIKDKRLLILGAGGAVRGLLYPILAQQPYSLVLCNRTLSTAIHLAAEFRHYGAIEVLPFEDKLKETFDLIINGTNRSNEIFPIISSLSPQTFCYDLNYALTPTPFIRWAVSHEVQHATDGIGMLVEQAAESFFQWRHIRPDTLPIIRQLKTSLSPNEK